MALNLGTQVRSTGSSTTAPSARTVPPDRGVPSAATSVASVTGRSADRVPSGPVSADRVAGHVDATTHDSAPSGPRVAEHARRPGPGARSRRARGRRIGGGGRGAGGTGGGSTTGRRSRSRRGCGVPRRAGTAATASAPGPVGQPWSRPPSHGMRRPASVPSTRVHPPVGREPRRRAGRAPRPGTGTGCPGGSGAARRPPGPGPRSGGPWPPASSPGRAAARS